MNTIDYRGNLSPANTDRLRSRNIWADCPIRDILEGVRPGMYFYDDFNDLPLTPTLTTQIAFGKYKAFNTTAGTISRVTAINSVETPGGALSMTTDTDNDSSSLAQAFPSYLLTGSKSNSGKLWFECCIAQASVATNMAATFVGLAETEQWTLATGVPFNGGDAITNAASAIGFRIEEDGLGVIDTVYSDRATAFTNIGDAEGGTQVAYTFRKLGFVYDPNETDNCITFFSNNLALPTRLSRASLQALTNLDANGLGLLIATCADSGGTAHQLFMKWWSVAQLFPN